MTALSFLAACSSTTVIKSNPSGAELYVDGKHECETPCTHADFAVSGTSKAVLLKKMGYKDFTGTIKKEEPKAGPMVGGILVGFPVIWLLGYPSEYTFNMEQGD
jgi:hypothetical protein